VSALINSNTPLPVGGDVMILPQDEYEAFLELENEFDVVCFQVVYDSGKFSHRPATPLLETKEQAQELLPMAKKQAADKPHVQNLRITKQTFFYLSPDDAGRQEMLAKIVKAGGES